MSNGGSDITSSSQLGEATSSSVEDVRNAFPEPYPTGSLLLFIQNEWERHKHSLADWDVPFGRKIPNSGVHYRTLKPIRGEGLYFRMVENPHSAENIARDWVQSWREDETEANVSMVQFIIDVSGFQYFTLQNQQLPLPLEEIADRIANSFPEGAPDFGFLFEKTSLWSKQLQTAIGKFLRCVVKVSERFGLLYEDILMLPLTFLIALAKSLTYPLRQTGIFFLVRFSLELGNINCCYSFQCDRMLDLARYSEVYRLELQDRINACEEKCQRLRALIQSLCGEVFSISTLYSSNLKLMYEYCAKHFRYLYFLIESPEIRLNILEALGTYVSHMFGEAACLAAVNSFEAIFATENFNRDSPLDISDCVQILYRVTLINNVEVMVAALKAFVALMKRSEDYVPVEMLKNLFAFVHNEYYAVGRIAGELLVTYIRNGDETPNVKTFFVALSLFQKTFNFLQYRNLPMVLVESIYHVAPELYSNLDVAINLLLADNTELNFDQELILTEIVAHSIVYRLTGKSTNPRKDSVTDTLPTAAEQDAIFQQVLPMLNALFNKFGREETFLKPLVLILKYLPYTENILTTYRNNIIQVLNRVPDIYLRTISQELLSDLSRFLLTASAQFSSIRNQSKAVISTVSERLFRHYEILLHAPEMNADVSATTAVTLRRLCNLLKFHAPTATDVFYYPDVAWEFEEEIFVEALQCEFYYLNDSERVKAFVKRSLICLEKCELLENKKIVVELMVEVWRLGKFPTAPYRAVAESCCKAIKEVLMGASNTQLSTKLLYNIAINQHRIPRSIRLFTYALYVKSEDLCKEHFEKLFKALIKGNAKATSSVMYNVIQNEFVNLKSKTFPTACDDIHEIGALVGLFLERLNGTGASVGYLNSLVAFAVLHKDNLSILEFLNTADLELSMSEKRQLLVSMRKIRVKNDTKTHYQQFIVRLTNSWSENTATFG